MRAADQWKRIRDSLPEGWVEARVSYSVEDPDSVQAAVAVLAPLGPGRSGTELRFHVRPSGPAGAESVRNLLARLDRKRIWGDLVLGEVRVADMAPVEPLSEEKLEAAVPTSLANAWDALLATVPPDWSDLLCELEVESSDYVPRATLLGAPLNPSRVPGELAARFRISQGGYGGYGASPEMARRCFERMDDDGVSGSLAVVNSLSQVDYVGTQGPVWRVAGRSV
jgi:hypothetical protein